MDGKLHVVAVPYPAQGHFSGVINLVKKIAAEGIIVTLVNISSIHRNLSKDWRCPAGLDIRLEGVHCDLDIPSGVDANAIRNSNEFVEAIERIQFPFEELVKKLQPPPRCIISDYFIRWAVGVTKKLRLQAVTYWPGTAAWSSLHHHVDRLLLHGDACRDPADVDEDKIISYIPGLEGINHCDLPSYYRRKLDEPVLYFFSKSADRMKDAEWILVNSISELESGAFGAMQESLTNRNFISVGPLFASANNGESQSLSSSLRAEDSNGLDWLDTRPLKSVLYVSFGSMCVLSEYQFQELAAGIETSGHAFLWVVQRELHHMSTEMLRGFIERTGDRGLVVPWAPQLKILAHRAVAGFLSHCGWNSVLESIFHGVPLLGWPCHSEQHMNCKLIVRWGIGKQVQGVERSSIAAAIREFMHGSEEMIKIRVGAGNLQEKARSTAKEGGSSHENLKKFLLALKNINTSG